MREAAPVPRVRRPLLAGGFRGAAQRLARLRRSGEIRRMSADVISAWDRDEFIRRFRPFWDPFPTSGPPKYLALDVWLRDAVARYVTLGLFPDPAPKRVLDLGCGMGFFLQVCAHNGHDVLGLDVDDEPLYNEAIDYFELPRVIHRIAPFEPLPDLGPPFDVITSFMTCFNFEPGGTMWGSQEWLFLLGELVGRLAPGGQVVIGFVDHPETGALYPSDLRPSVRSLPGVRARFFGEYLRLSRRASG